MDGALEIRRIANIKVISAVEQGLSRGQRLFSAVIGEVDICPTREAVFKIPFAFSVAKQHKFHFYTAPLFQDSRSLRLPPADILYTFLVCNAPLIHII